MIAVDSPAPKDILPLDGLNEIPGAEADQVVGPVIADPPLVMVKTTLPVLLSHFALTEMLDLSQTSVAVGIGVLVEVGSGVLVTVGKGVGVSGCLIQDPFTLRLTEESRDVL